MKGKAQVRGSVDLPCTIGETLYVIHDGEVKPAQVNSITVNINSRNMASYLIYLRSREIGSLWNLAASDDDFGSEVFYTEDDAFASRRQRNDPNYV